MTENEAVHQVQVLRDLITDYYRREDWLLLPHSQDPGLQKLNIILSQEIAGGSGKLRRLETLEVLAALLGWHNGTTASGLWRDYERFKKSLGRGKGHADRAYRSARAKAKRAWRIGSTKDLLIAEVYGLLSWLDENGMAKRLVQAVFANPVRWGRQLNERVRPVTRPTVPEAPPEFVEEELPLFEEEPEEEEKKEEYVPF
jgi:hypothetical protein